MITAFMIISTIVVYRQLQHFRNMDLGFDREGIISVRLYGDLWVEAIQKKEVLRERLLQNNNIVQVAASSNLIGDVPSVEFLLPDGVDIGDERPVMRFLRADEHYLETMGIELLDGKTFSPGMISDSSTQFIINEKAMEVLHLDESPVGNMATNKALGIRGEIVGVMKNCNFASLHHEIEPLVIEYRLDWMGMLMVRIKPDRIGETIEYIDQTIKEVVPGSLFLYTFLDDHLNALYQSEQNMSRIFQVFALLAIFISCLGLFGLASYSVRLQVKEIGIRKSFGASAGKILLMISGTYIRIIFVAILFAIPIANYFMSDWLKGFAYKTNIDWWIFALAGLAVILVGMAAIFHQALKAAQANPVNALRNE
jgi:putative ABC transport system permease protein